ncbi:rod shape-determining protein MreC [Sphingomonas nostoxanthinifaciens]|uniref:rod shape-determining protein MreC n=1 Tax=Sphingomonas nostoxanthinifaciens TaxID=2872652 RepID=UPI001CC2034C|nr:rod shape-determining protein MreC [Sphingomonas nostoxanthinifaciens]UAK23706.1 rod shape-determining protein MreC [Sphingomonas nostoxanthinifaciens]
MAPPRHRDRGFSRRLQYGLFFGYVAAALGIVVALGLVLVAKFDPLAFQGIRGFALDLTSPASILTRPISRGADDLATNIGDYVAAGSQNEMLRRQLAAAERGLVQARILAFENARLRRISHLIEQGTQPVVTARLVGSDLAGTRRYATLAAGSADGVRAGQPVRGPDGLVGRVAEAGLHASRVELLTDGGSSVPLRVVRTGAPALAEGRGAGVLDIHSTQAGAPPLVRGDLLVTSGVGGVYPPDLPVAVVTSTSGEVANGRPLADPTRLDVAMVLAEAAAPPALAPPTGRHK